MTRTVCFSTLQYDTSPKSAFYSWVVWARDNLSRDHQRVLFAFHEYMCSAKYRFAIMRQANFVSV